MGLCVSKSGAGGGGGSTMRRGGALFETPDMDSPSFSVFLNCSASLSSSSSPLTPKDSPRRARNCRPEVSLEVAANKVLLIQGVKKIDGSLFVPAPRLVTVDSSGREPGFSNVILNKVGREVLTKPSVVATERATEISGFQVVAPEVQKSAKRLKRRPRGLTEEEESLDVDRPASVKDSVSKDRPSVSGTSLLEESRSNMGARAMTPNLSTQLDQVLQVKKIGVEKEHIKRLPLKRLNSNVLFSLPDFPGTKMPLQALADNDNNSRAAMDTTTLDCANTQLEFASDENSTADRKLMKSSPAILHESSPLTDACQTHNSDAREGKSADRKELLQFSSLMTTLVQMNLGIPVSGCAAVPSVLVKDHLTSPSSGVASSEDSTLCIDMPATEQVKATSSTLVVRAKVSEEVEAGQSEGVEVSPNAKSREILREMDGCCVEDEQKNTIVNQLHNSRAGLNYSLSEVQDFDDVTGDQITFIEIVLNTESGGFVTETTVHSDRFAEKSNLQERTRLSEGVKPRKVEGKKMDLCLDSDTVPTGVEVGCHQQPHIVVKLQDGAHYPHGGAVRNKAFANSREICHQGFDACEDLQVKEQSAVRLVQAFAKEQCQLPIEQHPTLQGEMKETSPSEIQVLGISAESMLQHNLPLLQIPEVPSYVPDYFTTKGIPDTQELEHDSRHLSSKDITDLYGGSREFEVATKIEVSDHSPLLQILVETADTAQLASGIPVSSSTYSDVAEDVKEFHEADNLSDCLLASFAETCTAESDDAASLSADLEADNMSRPAGAHVFQALLEKMNTSKDGNTQMNCEAAFHLQDEEYGGKEEATVRHGHLNGSTTTECDIIADPLDISTPSSTTPSTLHLSRDRSPTISGASTRHQLTNHLLPGALSAEEIAEIWGAFRDSLAPFSASSTP